MPDTPSPSPSSTPSPMAESPPNQLKRKERPDEAEPKPPVAPGPSANPLPSGVHVRPDEYEAGRVICETCGTGVSFRDEQSGTFTVNHWEAHRLTCPSSASVPGESVMYTPETVGDSMGHPPSKRRRAKRTEEERIEYLRADPYVGQFEAYRVLCASCDKWIRLRPNSTYCSIPWDAHRKSCLAKKINNKNVYALEERNTLFSKDPDVRKFDPERLLCNMCDKWLSVPSDDHLQAVQKWLHHRSLCQRSSGAPSISLHNLDQHAPPPSDQQPGRSASHVQHRGPISISTVIPPGPSSPKGQQSPTTTTQNPSHNGQNPGRMSTAGGGGSPSSFHDLNPSNYAPAHESRRRNAEQRAATLRADSLIGEVEPNRVFCSLCQKWVQLRQDSSYCAYPWIQHRTKCVARHQRRSQKAAEIADMKARKQHQHHHQGQQGVSQEEDELLSDRDDDMDGVDGPAPSEDMESEEGGAEAHVEEDRVRRKEARRVEQRRASVAEDQARGTATASSSRHPHHFHQHSQQHLHHIHHHHPQQHHKSRSLPYVNGPPSQGRYSSISYRGDPRGPPPKMQRSVRPWDEDIDADGELDIEGDYPEDQHLKTPPPHLARTMSRGVPRRPWPIGLADLDSPSGRKQFIFGSVEYLFATTYESTDDMSISALLAYLNAAMPQDKHEDFDTSEVARAVATMKEKGRVIYEGDILRWID